MNALLLFGEDLKKNRQEKQISLIQVAASTRIHVRFLEAIEAGQFSVLPQPYIRSFLREYAVATELNPLDVLGKYDAAMQTVKPAPVAVEEKQEQKTALAFGPKQQQKLLSFLRRLSMPFAGIFIALVAVIFLANSGSTNSLQKNNPSEVSFDRVVKETEAAVTKAQPVLNKTQAAPARTAVDSLRLEMTTTDSLWIVVVIDENRKEEYLFPPKSHRSWAAREQFSITMGNAGNAQFKLNGKDLGTLGRPGAVIRNTVITEDTAPNL